MESQSAEPSEDEAEHGPIQVDGHVLHRLSSADHGDDVDGAGSLDDVEGGAVGVAESGMALGELVHDQRRIR